MTESDRRELLLSSRRWSALLAGMLVIAAGCNRHGRDAPKGGSDVPPHKTNLKRNVELAQAEQRSLVYCVETVGVLEAEGQTEIAAGVSGIVDEVLFREGDQVDTSTILVKVDQRRYESLVKAAEAAVEKGEANVRRAEANIKRTEANIKLWTDLSRRAMLAGAGSSEEERAKLLLNIGVAEAERAVAQTEVGAAQSELASARAALDLARHNLARSQVRAPYPGRINQRKVTPGSYLEERTVIGTIANLSRIRLVGYVPETAAPIVRALMAHQDARIRANRISLGVGGLLSGPISGSTCAWVVQSDDVPSGFDPEFRLLVDPKRALRGRIFYLSTVANPDTHMFEFKAEFDVRGLHVEPRPGYTAQIRIPLRSNADAVVIPEEAVRASEQGFVAFVPIKREGRDGKPELIARMLPLELGFRAPGWVEVRSGIVPGQTIVRRGAEALENGTPIQVAGQ
jgi:membrane fusion protein, multidrug efflux system